MQNPVIECLKSHRSIRKFKPTGISAGAGPIAGGSSQCPLGCSSSVEQLGVQHIAKSMTIEETSEVLTEQVGDSLVFAITSAC